MKSFFLSIFTAIIVGAVIAGLGIQGVKMLSRSNVSDQFASAASAEGISKTAVLKDEGEDEADPTFISRFSRGFAYTSTKDSKDEGEIAAGLIGNESLNAMASSSISALAYSVTNIDRNTVVLEKDPDRLLPIASVSKLITAVLAKKLLKPDDVITITPHMLATEGATGHFRLGEKIKVSEIMYPLLMVSSNDAAVAIADTYDKTAGRGKFVKELNTWVNTIGAYRTHFSDPSGLSPNNLSTAHDISLIAKWIMEHEPEIFDITMTKSETLHGHTWINPTHFLNISSYQGGKNGYTTEANLTSVSLFEAGFPKRLYSVVLLGSKQRDADTLAALNESLR